MALNEQQEKELLEAIPTLKKQVGDLTAQVSQHTETIKAKDAEISALKQGHTDLSRQGARMSLKAAYPDVPDTHLEHALTIPAEKQAEFLKPIQDLGAKAKAAPAKADSADAMSAWARTGSIGPTDDAARAAEAEQTRKMRDEAKGRGDVFGMLKARSGEATDFLRRSFAEAGLIKG